MSGAQARESRTELLAEEGAFVAFVPLGNWVAGFDRYGMSYSKEGIAGSRYPDRFYMHRRGEDWSAGASKARALSEKLGQGGQVAWMEARLPMGPGGMEPNRWTGTGVGWGWPGARVKLSGFGLLDEEGQMRPARHEELTAAGYAALRGAGAMDWKSCAPRTLSALPIAMACQARCAFCFSKSSASEAARQAPMDFDIALGWSKAAFKAGARRSVITGGGEPTLMKPAALERLVGIMGKEVGQALLITNAAIFGALGDGELEERLAGLERAGLSRMAISRHGVGREAEMRAMGIDAGAERVARALAKRGAIKSRAICVLQKGGVYSPGQVEAYLRARAEEGVDQVCFKELYVSSLSENAWAPSKENAYAAKHQVGLCEVASALESMGFEKAGQLPWGAPVYEGEAAGARMSVAAYTEPSVGWELAHRQVRSWNLMADGKCLASLEDMGSELSLEDWR